MTVPTGLTSPGAAGGIEPRDRDLPTEVPLDPGADLTALDGAKILAAPDDPARWPDWRAALARWQAAARRRHGLDGAARPSELDWTAECRCLCLAWLWDELLYDRRLRAFTPDRLLAAGAAFGGYDAVLLWHAYPVIGLDDRNQFDWYRDVPGLPALVAALQAAGVRVFLDYNPWDTGTRRTRRPDGEEVAALVADLGADGVFLDTLRDDPGGVGAAVAARRPAVALASESTPPAASLARLPLSWAQWYADSPVPGVQRSRLLDRGHLTHGSRRWNRDHSAELHSAWMNAAGMLVWENVFGSWVGWSERDRAALRMLLRVQRGWAAGFRHGAWVPLADLAPEAPPGLAASRWEHAGDLLWTVVNRSGADHAGPVLHVSSEPGADGADRTDGGDGDRQWWDLGTGAAVRPVPVPGGLRIDAVVPARGLGGVVATRRGRPVELLPPRPAGPVAVPAAAERTLPVRRPAPVARVAAVPAGFVPVPRRSSLVAEFRLRECGCYGEPAFDDGAWKPLPPVLHRTERVPRPGIRDRVAIAVREVSNAEYAEFLAATGWRPAEPNRFLRHWTGGRVPPAVRAAPVTFVELGDARAYARWRGWRLPTEDEWQAAGEAGLLGRRTPHVWNWTESEHCDGRSRFAVLKGGAGWRAEGSDWYFDGGPRGPEFSAKLLLPGAGLARSATVGFRCAVDLAGWGR